MSDWRHRLNLASNLDVVSWASCLKAHPRVAWNVECNVADTLQLNKFATHLFWPRVTCYIWPDPECKFKRASTTWPDLFVDTISNSARQPLPGSWNEHNYETRIYSSLPLAIDFADSCCAANLISSPPGKIWTRMQIDPDHRLWLLSLHYLCDPISPNAPIPVAVVVFPKPAITREREEHDSFLTEDASEQVQITAGFD